jgi:hypothetical protein
MSSRLRDRLKRLEERLPGRIFVFLSFEDAPTPSRLRHVGVIADCVVPT